MSQNIAWFEVTRSVRLDRKHASSVCRQMPDIRVPICCYVRCVSWLEFLSQMSGWSTGGSWALAAAASSLFITTTSSLQIKKWLFLITLFLHPHPKPLLSSSVYWYPWGSSSLSQSLFFQSHPLFLSLHPLPLFYKISGKENIQEVQIVSNVIHFIEPPVYRMYTCT